MRHLLGQVLHERGHCLPFRRRQFSSKGGHHVFAVGDDLIQFGLRLLLHGARPEIGRSFVEISRDRPVSLAAGAMAMKAIHPVEILA